jgi:uncharacterized membrane protein
MQDSPVPSAGVAPPQPEYWPPRAAVAQPAAPANGLASIAFGLAVGGLLIPLLAVAGVVCGHIARHQIDRSGGAQTGRGFTTAALIIGWLIIGFWLLLVVIVIIAAASSAGSYSSGY